MHFSKRITLTAIAVLVMAVTTPVASQAIDDNDRILTADSLPARWHYSPDVNSALPTDGIDTWWKYFNDPTLDSLISRGLEHNYDVKQALHRMAIARRSLGMARSQYFPTLNLNAGWSRARQSGAIAGHHTPATTTSYYSLGVDMSWQIDLFGKITARTRESAQQWLVSKAEAAGTMLTLCGDIATDYVNLRVLESELEVATAHLKSQEAVLNITKARHEAGLASALDVLQASTVYYSTRATIPGLRASIATTRNALDVLLGAIPGEKPVITPGGLPDHRAIVAAGVPMDLLRRRPDIIAAEATLASYAAALGIAKKEFLPTLTLQGSISTAAHDISDLFANNSLEYSIAPTLSWTIFDGLSRKYAVASAREQMQEGIDAYNLTVLTATKEVENALVTYSETCREVDFLTEVVEQARKSVELSVNLYKGGLSGFTEVADAQMNYLTYSNSLLQARGDALTALVNLCQALGGGWDKQEINNL